MGGSQEKVVIDRRIGLVRVRCGGLALLGRLVFVGSRGKGGGGIEWEVGY